MNNELNSTDLAGEVFAVSTTEPLGQNRQQQVVHEEQQSLDEDHAADHDQIDSEGVYYMFYFRYNVFIFVYFFKDSRCL